MRLFSYCIQIDDGAAPNPFWGLCTLTICKPVIRRVAEVGDWIAAIGSVNVDGKDYSGKLVYAMKVTSKLSLEQYDEFSRGDVPEKIPDLKHSDYRRNVGDCQYDYSGSNNAKQRKGVHQPANRDKDMRGLNSLLSKHFYYFGKKAVKIPLEFSLLLRQGQGHQSTKNEPIKTDFVLWLQKNFVRNKLYGGPQVELFFVKDSRGNICASRRCDQAAEDEEMYTREGDC